MIPELGWSNSFKFRRVAVCLLFRMGLLDFCIEIKLIFEMLDASRGVFHFSTCLRLGIMSKQENNCHTDYADFVSSRFFWLVKCQLLCLYNTHLEWWCLNRIVAGMDFHELLDIPQGDRRKYHDDVTVMVISLEGRIWKSSGKYPWDNETFNLMLALYTCDNFLAPKCAMKPVPKFQSRSIFHGSGCVVPDLTTLKMINWGI